ncbi:cysteine desulfurase family protein [Numidum massiliense]|uniref:cysteine desulfurase family protein n=1 Tax=Numidum massiliense TaxID=1522315 RepID=UPI0006D5B329|nr:cysteine desulfurase family protein [Numidum massiliense]
MSIYLDHAATTPLHPAVREAMLPYLDERFGNPSSIHRYGRQIRAAIDKARDQVATSLNCDSRTIVFTSGGTEADNTALIGAALALRARGKHIVTTAIEHQAVLDTCRFLEEIGYRVTYIPVDGTGMVHVEEVAAHLTDETVLVSVMYGNNEVGTVQPIAELGALAREKGVLFHTDAVQAFGSIPLDLQRLPVDLLTVAAHKINGPKGVGALYVAPKVHLAPLQFGGSQERQRRAGTENVPGIVGFGEAAAIAAAQVEEKRLHCAALRRTMLAVWEENGIDVVINGHPTAHLPHILNISFRGVDTEAMLMNLDLAGIACSSGSACTAGSLQPSHVLQAMQLSDEVIASAIRISFGRGNTVEDVTRAAEEMVAVVKRLKK